MNKKLILILNSAFLILNSFCYSQTTDSSWQVYKNIKNPDTVRLEALNNVAWDLLFSNSDSTYRLALKELEYAKSKKLKKWESKALNCLGGFFHVKGNYLKAIENYQQSLKIREELGDKEGVSGSLGNIGGIYIDLGEFEKALEYQLKCLKIFQSLNNSPSVASVYNNLGIIYVNLHEFEKALQYSKASFELYKDLGDKNGMSAASGNVGNVYSAMKDYSRALECYQYNLKLAQEAGNLSEIAQAYAEIGDAYFFLKKYPLALENFLTAKKISSDNDDASSLQNALHGLYETYKEMGNKNLALKNYELFISFRDSVNKEENKREINRKELEFKFERKAASDSTKNADEQKVKDVLIYAKTAQIEQDNTQKLALLIGVALLFILGAVMFNRFRITRKQKHIIELKSKQTEEQKLIIEEKQKEILSSIAYAKRLQEAILPPKSLIAEYLTESFIFYKPKDIVAGDFYWLEHEKDLVFFAAADCTGHGVPGAMVSVVCSNALNRTVKEFEIKEPGKILDKVLELVVETFARGETDVKDGMDISLCVLNKKTNELKWAGANNPLWIVRKGKLINFIPNKQSIGIIDIPLPYKTETIILEKQDGLYLFTDGYADQFGGPNGKKFKHKQLEDLILNNAMLPLNEQHDILVQTFKEWKGNHEQVDDVLVLGVKV